MKWHRFRVNSVERRNLCKIHWWFYGHHSIDPRRFSIRPICAKMLGSQMNWTVGTGRFSPQSWCNNNKNNEIKHKLSNNFAKKNNLHLVVANCVLFSQMFHAQFFYWYCLIYSVRVMMMHGVDKCRDSAYWFCSQSSVADFVFVPFLFGYYIRVMHDIISCCVWQLTRACVGECHWNTHAHMHGETCVRIRMTAFSLVFVFLLWFSNKIIVTFTKPQTSISSIHFE